MNKGSKSLAVTHPDLAAQAVGWDPTTVTAGTGRKLRWRCEKDHEWFAKVNNRARGNNCPVCSGQQVLAGFNDLMTTHPKLGSQAAGWGPRTTRAGSQKKMRWRCDKDHEWIASVSNRTHRGSGCPSCATAGFDPNLPSWLYFIEHDGWEMLQIGITNYPEDRLRAHKRLGWKPLEIRGPLDGSHTRDLETDILRSLARRGAKFANKAGGSSFDGWREAWIRLSLPVASLKELMDFVYEDDQKNTKPHKSTQKHTKAHKLIHKLLPPLPRQMAG